MNAIPAAPGWTGQVLDRAGQDVLGRTRVPACSMFSSSGSVTEVAADQADDRHQRDDRREHRQHPVVGQRGRPVGHVVGRELLERALQRVLLRAAAQIAGAVRRAAVGRAAILALGLDRLAFVLMISIAILSPPPSRPASSRSASCTPVRRRAPPTALTSAKIAPCSAAAGQDLPPRVLALQRPGDSSSSEIRFQICLKMRRRPGPAEDAERDAERHVEQPSIRSPSASATGPATEGDHDPARHPGGRRRVLLDLCGRLVELGLRASLLLLDLGLLLSTFACAWAFTSALAASASTVSPSSSRASADLAAQLVGIRRLRGRLVRLLLDGLAPPPRRASTSASLGDGLLVELLLLLPLALVSSSSRCSRSASLRVLVSLIVQPFP